VSLDRQSIEKKDFPVGQRGYDPEAVDAHLSGLADEIAEYKRSARRRNDALASTASEQVRAIVEAAERSAGDIQRDAESDAREIRDEAHAEAQATRERANEEAREYLGKISESASTTLGRLDAMQHELRELIDSLRAGSNRLGDDLRALEGDMNEVSRTVAPHRSEFEPDASATPAGAESDAHAASAAEAAPAAEPAHDEPASAAGWESEPSVHHEPAPEAAELESVVGDGESGHDHEHQASAPDQSGDAEGARLIALNMALNGTPREQTERYLTENFHLTDARGLLDEVYASVEG
jgi:cell division septum initiation protein DivIVA